LRRKRFLKGLKGVRKNALFLKLKRSEAGLWGGEFLEGGHTEFSEGNPEKAQKMKEEGEMNQ